MNHTWAESEGTHGCGAWMQGLHLPGVGRVQGLPYEGTVYVRWEERYEGSWMGRDTYEIHFRSERASTTAARPSTGIHTDISVRKFLSAVCVKQLCSNTSVFTYTHIHNSNF